ncbi:MAG: 3-methyl-2-oxobutanoate hydroxymethyltransferase [Myxococcota bacterium]|jgi:3-methyl-2-oxobutanoate hydroxymethyltransferase
MENEMPRKTVLDLQRMKASSHRIAMVTAYDATMARLVDAAGVDMVLVGDSVGMVIQGHEDTLSVTLDDMIYHARCVARGLTQAHLTVDLPFMTYQVSPEQALQSAGRLVKEGRAQSVKLEGGARSVPAVQLIINAGIPVVGHLGLTPQSVNTMGGYRVQAREDAAAEQLLEDALALQDAGAFCLVLEMVPAPLAAQVTAALQIPTIGIGAGPRCDGQVLVCNDLLGLDSRFKPRFVKRFAELETPIVDAVRGYVDAVHDGSFPTREHSFGPRKGAKPGAAAQSGKITRLY